MPPVRAYGAARSRGRGASCPLCAPLPREWGGWGRGSLALGGAVEERCPGRHAPHPRPFRASGAGVPFSREQGSAKRERGRGGGNAKRRALVRHPSARMDKGGVGGRGSRRPFHVYRAAWLRGKGRGQRRRALVRPPSARMRCRRGRREEARRRRALCAADLRAKGAAVVNAGEGGVGLRALFDEERRGEGGEKKTGRGKNWVDRRTTLLSSHPPRSPPAVLPIRTESGVQDVPSLLPSPSPPISAALHLRKRTAYVPIPYITRRPVRAQTRGTRGYATPGPALPIRSEGECTRARRPQHLPYPLATPPRTRGRGHGHLAATGLSPSPFDRAALYARDRGAQGQATPDPILPFTCGRGADEEHAAPGTSLRPHRPVRAGKGRARASDPRPHPPHSRGRGVHKGHDAPLPLDHAAPYARTGGTRGQAALPHSRGKGCTRPPASLHVAQQGRRHAPAFNVPDPHFHVLLYNLDKKIDVD
ncbi:hypothetical protein EDB83DRAFT_2315972 [Lactarius deliciosus]|nr:hypothetical protein EDB83DRAFT_2315972 [Lactarius deliciosus]